MFKEAKRFVAEEARRFVADERGAVDPDNLDTIVLIVLLALATSSCKVVPVNANANVSPEAEISQIYLSLVASDFPPNLRVKKAGVVYQGRDTKDTTNIFSFGFRASDPLRNLEEICSSTADYASDEEPVFDDPYCRNDIPPGEAGAGGFIETEKPCVSARVSVTARDGRDVNWEGSGCVQ